jgi:hypothetical protein
MCGFDDFALHGHAPYLPKENQQVPGQR